MTFSKKIILVFIFFIPVLIYGQPDALTTIDVLKLKHKRYYRETDSFEINKVITFTQDVYYDEPSSLDEEFHYTLVIYIDSINQVQVNRVCDIDKDSAIIQLFYSYASAWNWNQGKTINSGTVEIISVSPDKIQLQESIIVFDEKKNRRMSYKGKRIFYKTQNMN